MEIKDVNSLTNMIMNKSAAVSGGAADNAAKGKNAGAEFLSLLNQQELFDPATTDIAASRPENSKKTAPVSKNKNKSAVAAQEKTAKDDKPVKNDNKDKKASAADSSRLQKNRHRLKIKKITRRRKTLKIRMFRQTVPAMRRFRDRIKASLRIQPKEQKMRLTVRLLKMPPPEPKQQLRKQKRLRN